MEQGGSIHLDQMQDRFIKETIKKLNPVVVLIGIVTALFSTAPISNFEISLTNDKFN